MGDVIGSSRKTKAKQQAQQHQSVQLSLRRAQGCSVANCGSTCNSMSDNSHTHQPPRLWRFYEETKALLQGLWAQRLSGQLQQLLHYLLLLLVENLTQLLLYELPVLANNNVARYSGCCKVARKKSSSCSKNTCAVYSLSAIGKYTNAGSNGHR